MLLGGVVPAGGDGRHIHAVDLPDGRVAAVEVAAVGASRSIVRTLVFGPLAAENKIKTILRQSALIIFPYDALTSCSRSETNL